MRRGDANLMDYAGQIESIQTNIESIQTNNVDKPGGQTRSFASSISTPTVSPQKCRFLGGQSSMFPFPSAISPFLCHSTKSARESRARHGGSCIWHDNLGSVYITNCAAWPISRANHGPASQSSIPPIRRHGETGSSTIRRLIRAGGNLEQ